MSKKNYSKYSKPEVTEEVVEKVTEPVEAPVVDEAPTESPVVEEPKPSKPVTGTVVNCSKLNIRKVANKNADILCEVKAGSILMIDMEGSKKEYYKVCTPAGIKGYCVKDYVEVK